MPKYNSLSALKAEIKSGVISYEGIVEYYLQQIESSLHLNAYVEVFAEEALQQARELDERYRKDPTSLGRLAGMVMSIKDVLCYKGHRVTGGSKILSGFVSLFSATAVDRLLAEDVIIIGRTNCDEFAMGSTNETSFYGPVGNAADPTLTPGGSSGGAAVSVQADTCLVALGTDTGGSVRQPAALCGVVGVKPTYGRISRYGLLAYGSSFDQIGVFSNSVEDAALLLEIMSGADDNDATTGTQPVPAYSSMLHWPKKARIAYLENAFEHPTLDGEIKMASNQVIEKLRQYGHQVDPVSFDLLEYAIPAYYILTTAEASTNLSRYDGVRYGHRSPEAHDLMEVYKKSRTEGFGTEVKRRILLGTFVLSSGYYDAYYSKAQKVRRMIRQEIFDVLDQYEFLLMPITTRPAWKLGETLDDPVAMYLDDIFSVLANMAGLPAASLPIGVNKQHLPMGIQLMANRFKEAELLAFSNLVLKTINLPN